MWTFKLAFGKSNRPYVHFFLLLPNAFCPFPPRLGSSTLTPSSSYPQHVLGSEATAAPGHWYVKANAFVGSLQLTDRNVYIYQSHVLHGLWREHLKSTLLAIPSYVTVSIRWMLLNAELIF